MKAYQFGLITDFVVMPLGGSLVALFISWSWVRAVRGGRPLTSGMKAVLRIVFFGCLGLVYIDAIGYRLDWPKTGWHLLTLAWFALVALVVYLRYRNREETAP
jgi:hypothetical protein